MRQTLIIAALLFTSLFPVPGRIERIMFIGNSITIKEPLPERGWHGHWGMAASQPDRDYAHRVQLTLTAQQGQPVEIRTVFADVRRWPADLPAQIAEFDPDVIIIQIGDNTTDDYTQAEWHAAYAEIAAANVPTLAVGIWRGDGTTIREQRQRAAVEAVGLPFVPIWDLWIPANEARQYADSNVAWHPNDAGMAAIAGRIVDALSTVAPGTVPPAVEPGLWRVWLAGVQS